VELNLLSFISSLMTDSFFVFILFIQPTVYYYTNTPDSTVEQRMLAYSVFAALNEAWIAFQGGK
jgi:hypothetical protein